MLACFVYDVFLLSSYDLQNLMFVLNSWHHFKLTMPNRTATTYFVEVLPCPTRSMGVGMEPLYIYKRKNRRASRASFFLIGLHQAKAVDGVHGNNCNRHGIVSGGRRFRPRLVGAARGVRKGVKGVLSFWCPSVLLLFGSFPGQLEARPSVWCTAVCFVLLVVILAADCLTLL